MKLSWPGRFGLGLLLLIFTWFTWRGVTMYYSGDDMMNMYVAWDQNPWRLSKAIVLFWMPVYRPLGGAIYRLFYAVFGFHPEPLYVFCWLILAANVVFACRCLRVLAFNTAEALTALSLILVHGSFQDLYLSAGTVYDRLCFLFTVLGIAAYPRLRARGGWRFFVPVCVLCILCMTSKESGVALPVLLFLYEAIYQAPAHRERKNLRVWLRSVGPLFLTLGLISAVFIVRVSRTPQLAMTTAYRPHASLSLWLTRVAEYAGILTYGHVRFTALSCALVLLAMAAAAVLLRNRAMLYGLAFFVVTITPVALIASRPGYVLYVPDVGLGLFFASALGALVRLLPALVPQAEVAAFLLVTAGVTWFHQRNWPAPFDRQYSPELRLSEQFRREYPTLPANSRLLFLTDEFPPAAWDLMFNLRLLYNDRSILVHRSGAAPDQRPDPLHPIEYDHVFTAEGGHYAELDNRDIAESIRLHILREYSVGREMDVRHRDFGAYIVSGVMDGEMGNPTRWTSPRAKLKFDLYPAPAFFTAKFWVPDYVAKPAARTLTVLVNGREVGSLALTKDGMNELRFPVAPGLITAKGFTLVDMNVANPYKDTGGTEFGVVLLRAGFEWARP
jgi:hypothetical protein